MNKTSTLVVLSSITGLIALITIFVPIFQPIKDYLIAVIATGAPAVIWWLERKARLVDTLNGNISKAREIRLLSDYLLGNRKKMNDGLVYRFLIEIKDRAANLEQAVEGWREIRREQLETEASLVFGIQQKEIRSNQRQVATSSRQADGNTQAD